MWMGGPHKFKVFNCLKKMILKTHMVWLLATGKWGRQHRSAVANEKLGASLGRTDYGVHPWFAC